MRIPFKTAVGVPMAAMAAAGVVAFSTSPASADQYGRKVVLSASRSGCTVSLYFNSSTKLAYAKVSAYGGFDKCNGFVQNTRKEKSSRTVSGSGSGWSNGVRRGSGFNAQACVYAYVQGNYKGWTCTSWY
jgi:hypothetical protein